MRSPSAWLCSPIDWVLYPSAWLFWPLAFVIFPSAWLWPPSAIVPMPSLWELLPVAWVSLPSAWLLLPEAKVLYPSVWALGPEAIVLFPAAWLRTPEAVLAFSPFKKITAFLSPKFIFSISSSVYCLYGVFISLEILYSSYLPSQNSNSFLSLGISPFLTWLSVLLVFNSPFNFSNFVLIILFFLSLL